VTLFIRDFSRKYRPKGYTSNQRTPKVKVTENKLPKEAAANGLSWGPIVRQLCFTLPFLYGVQNINAWLEVIETKYPHMVKSLKSKYDVYDDVWGRIIQKYCNCRDTLFNRRIIQLIAFSTACFFGSLFILRSKRLIQLFGASASSSFFSPVTAVFMHGSVAHLAANMLSLYVLTIGWYGKGPLAAGSLDGMSHQHLLTFLITTGAAVSILGNIRYKLLSSRELSVGFSGALCALLMFEVTQKPESRVSFVFAPEGTHFSFGDMGKFFVGFELLLLAFSKYHRIDSLGHLLGFAIGYVYSKYGIKRWNDNVGSMTKICDAAFNQK
jgi:membrane associated rhomboid family serine protease